MRLLIPIVTLLLLSTSVASARPDRPNQIPNGTKNRCLNCHMSASGGDLRNAFGHQVEDGFLAEDATVIWGAELAALDSDGDGRSNGQELQDPSGSWRVGQPMPGNLAAVSNPGVEDAPTAVPALGPLATVALAAGLSLLLACATRRSTAARRRYGRAARWRPRGLC